MDRNIDERIRKPRKTKGTPLYRIRNLWSLGLLAVSGFTWYLYELWPQSRKLKLRIEEGKFELPEAVQTHFEKAKIGLSDQVTADLWTQVQRRLEDKEAQQTDAAEDESDKKKSPFWPVTISKYFQKPPPELSVDSPFRDTLSKIEQNAAAQSEESDFRTPEKLTKRTKPFQETKKTKNPPRKRLRQKKINSLIRSVEENFAHENVSCEHLQMALALSRSVERESVEENCEDVYNAVYQSTQEKINGVKRTLEEFGFKCGRSRLAGVYQNNSDANKKRKKSKFQYITPVLFMRTEEDRQRILSSKISLILSENFETQPESYTTQPTDGVSSEYLQNFRSTDGNILQLNSLPVEELTCERLYVKNLNLSPSKVKCGSLLKDWSLIPGRETTPLRETSKNCKANVTGELQKVESEKEDDILSVSEENMQEEAVEAVIKEGGFKIPQNQRSISPDLFASDDEVNKSFTESNFGSTHSSPNAKNCQISKNSGSFATFSDNKHSQKDLCSLESKKTSFDSGICEKIQEKVSPSSSQRNELVSCVEVPSNVNYDDNIGETSLLSFENGRSFASDDKDDVIESEKGILHFESFCKESEILSQEYVDLTQSSDEENEEKRDEEEQKETNQSFEVTYKSNSGLKETVEVFDLSPEIGSGKFEQDENTIRIDNENEEMLFCTEIATDLCLENSIEKETENLNNSVFQTIHFEESFHRDSLNVTDYIHNILNQNETQDLSAFDDEITELTKAAAAEKPQTFTKHASFSSVTSTCSQESIYISDEELNYSSTKANAKESSSSSSSNCSEDSVCVVEEDLEFSPKTTTKTDAEIETVFTPTAEFVVRTTNVTPMPDFDRMDTPKVTKELRKIGVKAMKRKRGVQLLQYIYDATHPFVGENVQIDVENTAKKRRTVQESSDKSCGIEIVGDVINKNELNDLIFEKRQSTKIHSCRLPLQIAFFNFVSCNPDIRKKILLYEPLQLEELHMLLKNQGFKYDIKDLLTFLDRKCITVRTNRK